MDFYGSLRNTDVVKLFRCSRPKFIHIPGERIYTLPHNGRSIEEPGAILKTAASDLKSYRLEWLRITCLAPDPR